MSRACPTLNQEGDLKPYKKKIPTEVGWYYLAIYNPEGHYYYEYHALLEDQTGSPRWHIGGTDEVSMKELKVRIKNNRKPGKQRLYLIGPKIPTTRELNAPSEAVRKTIGKKNPKIMDRLKKEFSR